MLGKILEDLSLLAVSGFYPGIINIADPSRKLPGKTQIVTITFEMPLATDLYPKCYQLIKFTVKLHITEKSCRI